MNEQTQPKGKIQVSPKAIASLAHEAVGRSYGVVGTVSKDFATGISDVLSKENTRGVVVQIKNDKIIIDLYVIIEYGTRIASVARSLMNVVKYTVEKALGVPIAEVNVHVENLRISSLD